MKNLEQFIGLYPILKTLRFELKPIGKTVEWMKKYKVLDNDNKRAEDYPKVKKLIDEYHKFCIENSLKGALLSWDSLADAIKTYRKNKNDKNKTALEKEQERMRRQVLDLLKKFKDFGELTASTPKDLMKNIFPDFFGQKEELDSFKGFATYFTGFQENRRNIYSAEPISTAVPFRVVHDNFPKFLSNVEIYNELVVRLPDVLEDAASELKPILGNHLLCDVFSIEFFNNVLCQSGIDFYNQLIGGVCEKEGGMKIKGINELVNLYLQQHQDVGMHRKSFKMQPLFKQILSDRETLSFIPQEFHDGKELVNAIEKFYDEMLHYESDGEVINVFERMSLLLEKVGDYDSERLYVNRNGIAEISNNIYKKWDEIVNSLTTYAEDLFGSPEKASNKKKIESYLKRDAFSFAELEKSGKSVLSYYNDMAISLKTIQDTYAIFKTNVSYADLTGLIDDSNKVEQIKMFLDAIMHLLHKAETLVVPEEMDTDCEFYNSFLPLFEKLRTIIPLYTKVRNYLTKKPTDVKKFKLNFDVPTLANGWDINCEKAYNTSLFIKNGLYYLLIYNSQNRPNTLAGYTTSESDLYKVVYHLISDASKDIPNLMVIDGKTVRKTGRKDKITGNNDILEQLKNTYLPERINKIRKLGSYKKGNDNFSVEDSREYIKYYMERLLEYKSGDFKFHFKKYNEYDSYSEFLDDVSSQNYSIDFTPYSETVVNEWVEEGKAFLFQIYNKDFAAGACGKKNLHTLLWEQLFSKENLDQVVLRLNGEAELFYRRESIKRPITHKVGEKMLNKRDNSGMPIPDDVYHHLYQYFNGKISSEELTPKDQNYLTKVTVKDVVYEIVKDRRYTKPYFLFHVPITINNNAVGTGIINEKVIEYVKGNKDVNIIGIDRGERHLVYLTLINQRGEILKQKTFNIVNGMNYNVKLTFREKERDDARKSWKTVGKIKELKEGFLSAVIHEIVEMMLENNAIVVLEDLNSGFKRGRFRVERQVYQKFEQALIEKLNYLISKDIKPELPGGILRGYQMAQKFSSFQKIGRQSGFLFYIPAAYTSKIDPVSGFVNLFNMKDITSAEDIRKFFMKFDSIKFISNEEGYEFVFNYDNFKCVQTDYLKEWTVYSSGKRIVMKSEDGYKRMVDFNPTSFITAAFSSIGVKVIPGDDVLAMIRNVDSNISNARFYHELLYAFGKTIQMRNSNADTEEDYIYSPVKVNGKHYCSKDEANKGFDANGTWVSHLPVDADANGAYHIALKGLYIIKHPESNNRIEHSDWFRFAQTKPYLSK